MDVTGADEPAPERTPLPVFVDDTGARHRRARVVGWLVGVLAAAYVALFAVSLVSSPGLLPLSIPGVGRLLPDAGAPDIDVPGHHRQRPGDVVSTATPRPATSPAVVPVSPQPAPATVSPGARPAPTPTASRSRTPSATPTTRAVPTGTPTARGTGHPTTRPSATRTPRRGNT